ncbi:hypothetical protein ACFRR6_08000 [Streptomyces sp. NPDC056891]|uniref:hypothetical protein n=1 Tax=Streptomyces sp. NPDC056891 TaxID=3345961 RepID=UPI00369C3F39
MDTTEWAPVGAVLAALFMLYKMAPAMLRATKMLVREYYNVKVEVEVGRQRALSKRAQLDE